MAPRYRRPEVSATMTICSRTLTLTGLQSPAVQVANHQPFQLTYPKCTTNIPAWADDLEINILVGFNVDPKHYKVHIHDLTPRGQPCPGERELKSLKDINVDQVVTGPYEVHFILRDDRTIPEVEDLRAWQQRFAAVAADPSPRPTKNTFVLCNSSHTRFAKLVLDDLIGPPRGDVERTLRHGLGLISPQTLLRHNLGEALGLDLEEVDIRFHLSSEDCSNLRGIDDLATATSLAADTAVKLHLPANWQHGQHDNAVGEQYGHSESDHDHTDDSE